MIIGADLQGLSYGASGGIVNWIGGVLNAYAETFPQDRLLVFIPEDFPRIIGERPSVRVVKDARDRLHRTEAALLAAESADVLVRAYPQIEQPRFPLDRQIVAIPDMQHADHPEFFGAGDLRLRRLAFGRMLSEVGAVATMTEFSRARVLAYPWTRCQDVFLMPPAVSFAAPELALDEPPWLHALMRLPGFFIVPANAWPHKNHRRLFEAFAAARARLPAGMSLVLTGDNSLGSALTAGFEHLPIIHLGYVPREYMPILYQRATALAFFSLYEGFGMPLLEAFQHGTPVVCSDIPPLAEVGGQAALRCDPTNSGAMADALVRIVGDAALRARLKREGADQLGSYSWTRSARALRDAAFRLSGCRAMASTSTAPARAPGLSVSAVIDVFDDDRLESAAVRALVAQTHARGQVIIAGTRYGAATWVAATGGRCRVHVIGRADRSARRRACQGLAAADGELITYLRSDCRVEPDALERLALPFAEDPACDIVVAGTEAVDESGGTIAGYRPPRVIDPEVPNLVFERHLAQLLGGHDVRALRPVFCWHRRIGDVAGSYELDYQHVFDLAYLFRLLRAGGTLACIEDHVATVAVAGRHASVRRWYHVMREIPRLLAAHGGTVDGHFFHLLNHRRLGIEPQGAVRSNPVASWMGVVHHALWQRRSAAARAAP